MKRIALERAADHLELAKAAIDQLDLENGTRIYSQAWSQFLSQASRFYSKLEQGAKGCPRSEPWFGGKKHERKKDPLLSYIHHARDTDEHGLDYVIARTGSGAFGRMAEGKEYFDISFQCKLDPMGRPHIRNLTTSTPEAFSVIDLVDPRMELITVRDSRFGDTFDPPEMHLGRPITFNSPVTVAKLAGSYMEQMLKEASELPEHI